MRYRVIANESTAKGFALFGVETVSVSEVQQAKKAFEDALQDQTLGAVIISKDIASLLEEGVSIHEASCKLPQILVLDI